MSELRRNLQINGETYHLAVNQYGDSSPKADTPGKPGVLYLNTFNGNLYKCTAADPENGSYTWVPMVGAGGIFATSVKGEGAEEISVMTLRIDKPNPGYILSIGDKLITSDNYLYEVTAQTEDDLGGYHAKLIRSLGNSSSGNAPQISLSRFDDETHSGVLIGVENPDGTAYVEHVYDGTAGVGGATYIPSVEQTSENTVDITFTADVSGANPSPIKYTIELPGCSSPNVKQSETLEIESISDVTIDAENNTFVWTAGTNGYGMVRVKSGELTGGLLKVEWDTNTLYKIPFNLYLYDSDGAAYKHTGSGSEFSGERYEPVYYDPSSGGKSFGQAIEPFTVQIPDGCSCMCALRFVPNDYTVSPDGSITTSDQFRDWMLSGGMTFTVEKESGGTAADIPAVLYTEQKLNDEQKTQARENIRAGQKKSNFQTIAHRGYYANAPQNSVQAIIDAANNGFSWVEVDIRKCADGVHILAHDAAITLYNNGVAESVTVADAKYSDICGYTLDPAGKHNICTLQAALAVVRRYDVGVVLDGKSVNNSDLMRLANLAGVADHVLLSYASPAAVLADKTLLDRYSHTPVRFIPSSYDSTLEVLQSIKNPVYADINAAWSEFTSKYLNLAFSCGMPILFAGCRADNVSVWAPVGAGGMTDDSAYDLTADDLLAFLSADYDVPTTISAPETVGIAVGSSKTIEAHCNTEGLAGYMFAYSDDPSVVCLSQDEFGQRISITATRNSEGSANILLFCANGAMRSISVTSAIDDTPEETLGEVEGVTYLVGGVSGGTLWAAGGKNRLTAAMEDGVVPYAPDATNPIDGDWYPIPVPATATAVTVSCPGILPGLAFLTVTDGSLKNSLDPGWQTEGGATYSFEAGAHSYLAVNFKNSTGTAFTDDYDTSQIRISFA